MRSRGLCSFLLKNNINVCERTKNTIKGTGITLIYANAYKWLWKDWFHIKFVHSHIFGA
jgi:hypothetical protein